MQNKENKYIMYKKKKYYIYIYNVTMYCKEIGN